MVATRNVTWDKDLFACFPEAQDGPYVELKVRDHGYGMDQKTRTRIYEPFFTTKPLGKGTGLGLATVYGVVKSHDGFINCTSAPGEGTVFTLYFPARTDRRKPENVPAQAKEMLRGGNETILLVDDEETIIQTSSELLSSFGYKVFTAQSGEDALVLYNEHRAKISLVLLDLGMPGMGGRRCLSELIAMDPKVRVIIASGYEAKEELLTAGAKGYINKPFRLTELLLQIRKTLDQG